MSIRMQDLLLYAGGECLQNFGVPVWRMSRAQDVAGAHTRASTAAFTDNVGASRNAIADRLRVDWLDLDGDGVREASALRLESADTFDIPWPHGTQAITAYLRYVDTGDSRAAPATTGDILTIGRQGSGNGYIQFDDRSQDFGVVSVGASGATASRAVSGSGVNVGDVVELCAVIDKDFGVTLSWALDDGAVTTEALATNANGMPSTWAASFVRMELEQNLAVKIVRESASLLELRALFEVAS